MNTEYIKDIWLTAHETIPIKEVSNIPKLKPKKQSKEIKNNTHN